MTSRFVRLRNLVNYSQRTQQNRLLLCYLNTLFKTERNGRNIDANYYYVQIMNVIIMISFLKFECVWGPKDRKGDMERDRRRYRERERSMLNVYSISCRNSCAGANENPHYQ